MALCIADDWDSMVGNPTKLGLSLLTIGFNLIFVIQHYCLYDQRVRCSCGESWFPAYQSLSPQHPINDAENPSADETTDSNKNQYQQGACGEQPAPYQQQASAAPAVSMPGHVVSETKSAPGATAGHSAPGSLNPTIYQTIM